MKRFGLICLLVIGAIGVKAQNNSRRDSLLLDAMKNLKSRGKTLQQQNFFKPWSTDSLLGKAQIFTYPGLDSIKRSGYGVSIKNGVTHSPIDHMPIASLPYNSRMPVYKLHSNDKMPGSNIPVQPNVQVVPQK